MKLDFENWQKIPAINNRLATKEDFEAGVAVFYQEGPAEYIDQYKLPVLAVWEDDNGKKFDVVVVQMEKPTGSGKSVVCGLYLENGDAVVCTTGELMFP